MAQRLRIAHIIYRLDFGGMENGLVNLLNRLPPDRFSHVIICLTMATQFRDRIRREDIDIVECHKPEGNHPATYWKILQELRRRRPDIVHTRNLGALDLAWIAAIAGVRRRIHSEHGWSPEDPRGLSGKHRVLRRLCNPAVTDYIAVSHDIARWLIDVIGIPSSKVSVIHNGVDTDRFRAVQPARGAVEEAEVGPKKIVFGTVGRQEPIKGLNVLLEAVRNLLERAPEKRMACKVVLAGDGPSRAELQKLRVDYGLEDVVEFPGAVDDVPSLLHAFSFFVQPSLNEGISNTVLEAMASGVPVIATDVGGNPELITDGVDGLLVQAGDANSLMDAIQRYMGDRDLRELHGAAARSTVESRLSLEGMVENYERMYCQTTTAMPVAAT